MDDDKIFSLLRSNTSAENISSDGTAETPASLFDISVNIPLLGYENITLAMREDGCIMTNILDTQKIFYVGEENT